MASLQQEAGQRGAQLKALIDQCRGLLDSLNMWDTNRQGAAQS